MTMPNETTGEWLGDPRKDFQKTASAGARRALEIARALPLAALGGVQVGFERTRQLAETGRALPAEMIDRLRSIPGSVADTFEERTERGRKMVERMRGRKSTRGAVRQFRSAGKQARGAATSARRAALRATRATKGAASSALNPQDARPYEERTFAELYELATERDLEGRSTLNKRQLIAALRKDR